MSSDSAIGHEPAKRQIRKPMLQLLVGNGAGQALQFASVIVLSRLYPPAAFGALGSAHAAATAATVICTLQLHLAIPQSRTRSDAAKLVRVVEATAAGIGIGLVGLASGLGERIYGFAAVLAVMVGLNNTYIAYLVYSGRFKSLAGFYFLRAATVVSLQFAFAWLELRDGLLWAAVLGEMGMALFLRTLHVAEGIWMGLKEAWRQLQEHRAFTLYGTVQELVSVAAFYAPVILFVEKFGEAVGGQYAMANRLVWAPVILLSGSVAQVLHHRFGTALPSRAELLALSAGWLGLATALAGAAAFFFPGLLVWLLGSSWGIAAELLPWQLGWGAVFLLSVACRVACRVLRQQRVQLAIDAVSLMTIWAMFEFGHLSPVPAAIGLLAIATVQNLTLMAWVASRLDRRTPG